MKCLHYAAFHLGLHYDTVCQSNLIGVTSIQRIKRSVKHQSSSQQGFTVCNSQQDQHDSIYYKWHL